MRGRLPTAQWRRQAIAIDLSEARRAGGKVPAAPSSSRRRSRAKKARKK
jgi:hypothetical protein